MEQTSGARIAVIGAGGVGGYYGGLLARAGSDVSIVARGPHLGAIRADGLRVRTPEGEWGVRLAATDDALALARSFGEHDFVILAVKAYSLPEIVAAVAAFAGRGATILPLLNGVDTGERLTAGGIDRSCILGGVTYLSAARTAPGVIERHSSFQRVLAGEEPTGVSARVESLVKLLRDAGVEAQSSSDIRLELWRKFVFLTTMSPACGLARLSIGGVRKTTLGRKRLHAGVHEAAAVARALGVAYTDADEVDAIARAESLPAGMKPSLLLDLEGGGPTEIDSLSGTVVRLGRQLGIETPTHQEAADVIGGSSGEALVTKADTARR